MPIISVVGRKQKKMRMLIGGIYVVLTLGAVTMVYPFILMVSTSFTSYVDQNEFRVVPRYIYNDAALFRKYIELKYNEDIVRYNQWFGLEFGTFEEVRPPKRVNRRLVEEWRRFQASLPRDHMMLGSSFSAAASAITPTLLTRYRAFQREKFHGDLNRLNEVYQETNQSWMDIGMTVEDWAMRDFKTDEGPEAPDYARFRSSLAPRYLLTIPLDGLYQDNLRARLGTMKAVNAALGIHPPLRTRGEIHLTARVPHSLAAKAWEQFIRTDCPICFVRLDSEATRAYREFIRRKYVTTAAYNAAYKSRIGSFSGLSMPTEAPGRGVPRVDWIEFLSESAPIGDVELISPDVSFRSHLARKFDTLDGMNRALGMSFRTFLEVSPPYNESDWVELLENRRAIRHEFIVRNYREVIEYIALHGRALLNTAILCLGIVICTLTVNPLCAYALSRFNLRSTYKILLFLLATMAFPAEVSAIPSFLLVKKLHLLGTYWAIILPSLASGYSIFLLKGFFDSLPKELYEAAIMDGATEMQMYWKITIQLSKPVLAVIGLGAFTMAYGSFMWAFLVCQNPKMWTLMVWLFQMQIWAPQYMVYAGLVLAAIPTLLVFIFCQNIIMRGIIIPSEK